MEVIRKNVRVDASRRVTVELPEGVAPGEHDVLVVVSKSADGKSSASTEEEDETQEPLGTWLRRTSHDTGPVEETTYRREDLYGDKGR
jgi:hypothetical protein